MLFTKINEQNTVIGSPLSGNHEEKNEANSSGSRLDSDVTIYELMLKLRIIFLEIMIFKLKLIEF